MLFKVMRENKCIRVYVITYADPLLRCSRYKDLGVGGNDSFRRIFNYINGSLCIMCSIAVD